jgi:hypothetical protein
MKKIKAYTVTACFALTAGLVLQGCGKEPSATPPVAQATVTAPEAAPAPVAVAAPTTASDSTPSPFTPEALDELLAPVALYPDALLAQVLASATKPQEVLDGGNWVIANPELKGAELEKAAKSVGFTPPMIALMSFPTVLDMMCLKMEWTTELGEAFVADEPGVRASVQRLRKQAKAMGNLQSSEYLKVENQTKNDQNVIVVQSPNPTVVYVPQYDPVTTYTTPAPAPAAATATATSTTVTESTGHSTGTLIATGLLAFGAGILVNEAFDDDDDDYHGYPYYPAYGNGFYPSNGYNHHNNYNKNTNININGGNNNYWNRYDGNRPRRDVKKPDWKDKKDYAGAKPELRDKAGLANRAPAKPATREIAKRPASSVSDRGRATDNAARPRSEMKRPDTGMNSANRMPDKKANAFQGARNTGTQERAASQRGKQSMQRSGGHGGKGGNRAAGRKR